MRSFKLVVLAVCAASVAASCGDDGTSNGALADAPPGGGKLDAGDPGAPPPVTLTVTLDGAPVEGVHTYFVNPDNTVAATVDTDASGTATAALPKGGTVTAIDAFPIAVATVLRVFGVAPVIGNNELRTFAGVKPGDHLVLDRNTQTINFTLRLPQSEPAADSFRVTTPCGGGFAFPGGGGSGSADGTPGGSFQLTGCAAKTDIAVVAFANGVAVGAFVHPAAELTNNGIVDLTGDAYTAATTRSFSYSNASDLSIATSHTLVAASGAFGPFGPADGAQGTIAEPTITGATGITDVAIRLNGTHHVIDAGPVAATTTLDLAGQLLPDFNGQASYNATNHLVTWMENRDLRPALFGPSADFTVTALNVSRDNRFWRWTVAAPYAAGKVEFPTLPSDLADWMPKFETDNINVTELVSVKLPGGYDQARAHVFDLHDALTGESFAPLATGITGRVVAVQLGRNVDARSGSPSAATAAPRKR